MKDKKHSKPRTKPPKNTSENEYVLGTGDDELSRLGIQHRIWADAAVRIWKKAGVQPGGQVLDVGCGPGFATLDLSQMVTAQGRILAVDESNRFLGHLRSQAETLGLTQIETRQADVHRLTQALKKDEKFDVIYCRWVLCWLKDPAHALREMAKVLKPGGRLVIHDYFNWRVMTKAPRSSAIEKMVYAAVEVFNQSGGDIDVAARIPKMLRESGLHLTYFNVQQRAARGGGLDSTIHWPLTWWRSFGPKLNEMGKLDSKTLKQCLRDLDDLENDPDQFFFCPPLFEFIASAR